jgi:hypothetical protein
MSGSIWVFLQIGQWKKVQGPGWWIAGNRARKFRKKQ